MRIGSWNLNRATWQHRARFTNGEEHRRASWDALGELELDVALVQEAAPPPPGLTRPPTCTVPVEQTNDAWRSLPGPQRWWCAAIASWSPELTDRVLPDRYRDLDITHQGAYAVAAMTWRDTRVLLASVYALWDYAGIHLDAKPRYAETSLHRTISDLTPVIDQARADALPVVLAGDLNASTQHPKPYRDAYRLVHARLVALGLVNVSVRAADTVLDGCTCSDDPCRHVRTYEGATPYQNDYIYVSASLEPYVRFTEMAQTPMRDAVSDHAPLVIQLES
jgi:hypothetical protein